MRSVLLTVLLSFLPAICFGQARAVIEGPEKAAPGNLVILNSKGSEADSLRWELVNPVDGVFPFIAKDQDGYLCCVFAIQKEGTYYFALSASLKDTDKGSTVDNAFHKLVIGDGQPGPDKPDVPDIVPDPDKPDDPKPPVNPEPTFPEAEQKIFDMLKRINPNLDDVRAVSHNLKTVVSQGAGLSWNSNQMVAEFKKLNRVSPFDKEETRTTWAEWPAIHGEFVKPAGTDALAARELFTSEADVMDRYIQWRSIETIPYSLKRVDPYKSGLMNQASEAKEKVNSLKRRFNVIKESAEKTENDISELEQEIF